ncbi:aminotransferase class I/II-fold pyridoxal phosphate-dependent enzyme [Corynebacterium poyangense]|uniref:Aminotransferase class I/II-fold pyridoxal phosphate-dependent enzyme n=1 Tax=Corynebacterium poyangense TaxID=2684405 RepID=A0A7H0SQW7_9CORY|nr:PLP-dependent aminotransferase family protein [Corynebacterium poyangense]QNQ90942.1 aminotransferase class I/II-fold pyridoxal phosphate-dependent enzyme [Corynebacterium poyangense]
MSSVDDLVGHLRQWIDSAAPGTQLPSSRRLVEQYRISPVTVHKAMDILKGLGLVESRPGSGTFVRQQRTAKSLDFTWQAAALREAPPRVMGLSDPLHNADNTSIAFHSGYPSPELLPLRLIRSALNRVTRSPSLADRSPSAGLPELQSWFAQELAHRSPATISPPMPRDVTIVPGTQSGLVAVFRSLCAPGQAVLCESPTYWGAILAARQGDVRLKVVGHDSDGPLISDLGTALRTTGAKVFYAQPTFHNPTGTQWSLSRREEVLEVIRRHGAFLIEDDWARDFAIAEPLLPLAALDDSGHVIYLRSLTKSISPAIRVGAIIARGPARDRILGSIGADALYVSGLLQQVAADVVMNSAWKTHLRHLRSQLAQRRDLLIAALSPLAPALSLVHIPAGGLNLWLRLAEGIDEQDLASRCSSRGTYIAAGQQWFPSDPPGQFIRLNYSSPAPSRFHEGAATMGEVLGEILR